MSHSIRSSAILFSMVALHVCAVANPRTWSNQTPSSRSLSVAGKVTDESGKPVPGATVYLREWAHARRSAEPERMMPNDILATTTTDKHGAFSFVDVPLPTPSLDEVSKSTPFPWDVIVVAREHALGWSRLPPKSLQRSLVISLGPEAKLEGRVTDANGKPIAGAQVRALRFQGLDQGPQSPATSVDNLRLDWSHVRLASVTNADGKFMLSGLPSEMRIALFVTHEPFARKLVYAATTEQPQPPVNLGRRRGASGEVTVREEPVHTGSFSVTLRQGHRLRVHAVYEDTGEPAVGAVLRQVSGIARDEPDPVADARGEFTINQLGAARYTFEVTDRRRPEYLGVQFSATIPAEGQEHEETVKLPRGELVSGKVVNDRDGNGIAGVVVGYQPLTEAAARLLPATVHSGPAGRFRIAVPPGEGLLEIAKTIPGYVMPDDGPTTSTEPDERFARPINVVTGRSTPEVTFTLSRGLVAHVRILDADGKPASGANVHGRVADRDGKLTLSGLFPFRNHEFVAALPDRKLAARFTVSPRGEGQPVAVDVKLEPTGVVRGRVLGEDGKPIRNSSIQLLRHIPDAETKIIFYAASDTIPVPVNADGTYVLEDLVAGGSYNVNVGAPGHASAFAAPFEGIAGGTHRLSDIVLPRADQTVAGTVVDARGRPLAGIQVYGTPVRPGGIEHSVRINSGQFFSDSAGRFRLVGIPRGLVRLSAYIAPTGGNAERPVRTHGSLMVEAGRQDVRLVLAGPDVTAKPEAFVGKPAPGFSLEKWVHKPDAASDTKFQPGDFLKQVIVVAFVDEAKPSTRCLARLNELHKKWAGKGLVVVRVYEGLALSADVIAAQSPTPAAVVSPGLVPGGYCEAHEKYGARATPTVFLIDQSGVLRFADVDLDSVETHLNEMLSR